MTMSSNCVPFCLDAEALRAGGRERVAWNPSRCPHLLVTGTTGSGKTYAVKLLLGKIVNHIPGARAVLCDYKADDFRFLAGCPRYYEFDHCTAGLDAFYEAFQARQRGDNPSRTFRLLVFDEWASYVSMLDKKEAEEAKGKLSTLLMLGRAFNFHVLVSQQRADAAYFSTARDNFNVVVALGNLSREGRDMFFSGFKDEMEPVRQLGEGYLLINGAELRHIQVPTVRDNAKLEAAIRRLVT